MNKETTKLFFDAISKQPFKMPSKGVAERISDALEKRDRKLVDNNHALDNEFRRGFLLAQEIVSDEIKNTPPVLTDKEVDELYQLEDELSKHIQQSGIPVLMETFIAWMDKRNEINHNRISQLESAISSPVNKGDAGGGEGCGQCKVLQGIIDLKEKERQEWADMCVKKQWSIESLQGQLDGYNHTT